MPYFFNIFNSFLHIYTPDTHDFYIIQKLMVNQMQELSKDRKVSDGERGIWSYMLEDYMFHIVMLLC